MGMPSRGRSSTPASTSPSRPRGWPRGVSSCARRGVRPGMLALNAGYEYEEQIDARAAGETLLAHLAGRYPHSTREVWRARIGAGEVFLDGRVPPPDTPLANGQK